MAVRTVEIRKNGEGYSILEPEDSNPQQARLAHEAANRADAEAWLQEQGGDPVQITKVIDALESAPQVFLELSADWSEAEHFPRR